MYEIILTACLSASGPCADRILPPGFADQSLCEAAAQNRAAAWADVHDLSVKKIRCAQISTAFEIKEVAPGIYVHHGAHDIPNADNAGDLANIGFVVGDKSVAVIDAGGSRQIAEALYTAIRQRTDLPIEWLILTHMHPDHSMGATVFKEAGAKIIGHENLTLALANRAETYVTSMKRLMGEEAFLGTRLIAPDISDISTIDLGNRILKIESYETAHTNTDITVLDQQSGTLFTGDLVFVDHTPALDGSILGWQAVLERMAGEQIAKIVPGHGPSPLPWPKAADPIRGYLAALTEETRRAIALGESMRRAIKHLGESQRQNWLLFDEYNKRNATAAYKELEWE